jgi:hypothetical protein
MSPDLWNYPVASRRDKIQSSQRMLKIFLLAIHALDARVENLSQNKRCLQAQGWEEALPER